MNNTKNLGAAKTGTGHYMMQKATSIALILLSAALAVSLCEPYKNGFGYDSLVTWLAVPSNAVLLILFTLAAAYHFAGHVREVVEDYVHQEGVKIILLLVVQFAAISFAVSMIYTIILMSFSGGYGE